MSTELIQKLNKLKAEADKINADMHRLQGSQTSLLSRLQDEFAVASIEDAKALLAKQEAEVTSMTADITTIVESLENQINNAKQQ